MNNICQKFVVATTTVATCLLATGVQPVKAASIFWDISFFDDNDMEVGNGYFSYDPDTTTLVDINARGDTISVDTILDTFSAVILGVEWDEPGINWWITDETIATRGQSQSRSGPSLSDGWFFGDPFFGTTALNIEGGSTDSNGSGTWSQLLVVDSGDPPLTGFGTWSATQRVNTGNNGSSTDVPEPLSILASMTALGLLPLLKKEHSKRKC